MTDRGGDIDHLPERGNCYLRWRSAPATRSVPVINVSAPSAITTFEVLPEPVDGKEETVTAADPPVDGGGGAAASVHWPTFTLTDSVVPSSKVAFAITLS